MSLGDVARKQLPLLYRVATRLTRTESEAEELVAETLYLAARYWNTFDGRYPTSWFVRIMKNAFYKQLGHPSHGKNVALSDLPEALQAVDPGPAIQRKITLDRILNELTHLSPEHRLVLTLCDIEEMSYEEAAKVLEVPIGTLCSRLYRARKDLVRRCTPFTEEKS